MKTQYKQCSLHMINAFGQKECMVTWLPAQYAIEGLQLKLKNSNLWEDNWIVDGVGDTVFEEKDMIDTHRARKIHRQNTGDSLRK